MESLNINMEIDNEKIYSISEFVAGLNAQLKTVKAKVVGEVGEAKAGPTGHMYFTLKDEKDGAMLRCIMWRFKYSLFGIRLEPGMKIVAYGNCEIYAPSGTFSFICETIELAGEGELKKQYDELKKKLEKEGLFDLANKRQIPDYVQKIGVITAKQGAVIHDFLNNIGQFGFKIKFIDSRVEGAGAVEDLLAAIKTFRNKDIDVLVIIRGGGSMESLMPFNNEMLVREVVGFPVPVVVGIGHDKDVPLVCLAADNSQSTPTAVANLLSESWEQALLLITRLAGFIRNAGTVIKSKYQNKFNILKEKVFSGFRAVLSGANEKLNHIDKLVIINNPERQLNLGYCIARINGKIIRRVADATPGQEIEIRVSDGVFSSEIKQQNLWQTQKT